MDINDVINQNKIFITNFIQTTLERYAEKIGWTSDLEMGFRIHSCQMISYHIDFI